MSSSLSAASENTNESKSAINAKQEIITPQINGPPQSLNPVGVVLNLTAGSINQILEGEQVHGAVIQVLGHKMMKGTVNNGYRLLISDGVSVCPFAVLDAHLNGLVTNRELEKFTIVRIDKCIVCLIEAYIKGIYILSLTVLVPGAKVGEVIGYPINSTSSATPPENANEDTNKSKSANIVMPQVKNYVRTIFPIANLTPCQNNWIIKARITNKTPIRTWNNSRGKGKYFSVNFLDESGEIRATGFNDAVDKFYKLLELNKVYYVSGATLETANKKYSTVNNDYEMTLALDTMIGPCEESF